MTTPAAPTVPPAPPYRPPRPRWIEPVRRDTRSELAYGFRYGASLVAVVLGAYLVASWSIAPPLIGGRGLSAILFGQDLPIVLMNVVQLAIATIALAGGLALAPGSPLRSLAAAAIAAVIIAGTIVVFYLRLAGVMPGLGHPIIATQLSPVTAALLSATLGWLIVRKRPLLAYPLLLVAFVPGLVRYGLLVAGGSATSLWFLDTLLLAVLGVGAAWIARALAPLFDRRR